MKGQARLLVLPGGHLKYTHDFQFAFLESHSNADWIADKGEKIGEALARSLSPMGYRLAEELFVLHPTPSAVEPHPVNSDDGYPELTWRLKGTNETEASVLPAVYSFKLAVTEGPANAVCLDWIARDTGSTLGNINPPCLLAHPDKLVYRRKKLVTLRGQITTPPPE